MKKIVFILILVVSTSYAYFQSDFLKNNYEITPPYFYGHYETGGGLDILKNDLLFLQFLASGKFDTAMFKKSSSVMNSYIKFNHNVFGFDIFMYDRMRDIPSNNTNKRSETTIVAAHLYQNNNIYENVKAGVEIVPFIKASNYSENDHNILTSDYKDTNITLGAEIYGGVSYTPLSSLNFSFQSGPQIFYNTNFQTIGVDLAGKLSVKYYGQFYLLKNPMWFTVTPYYIKNFFENNFGCELFVKPRQFINILLGINQNRLYESMNIRLFNFMEIQVYNESSLKQKDDFFMSTGITLYYKSLGFPTFR